MPIYELTHLFFRHYGETVLSPKSLGLFCSYECVQNAIQYYNMQPGFCENQDAFSVRERNVTGSIVNNTVYEVLVYFHSEDYEFETVVELGLYGDEAAAQKTLTSYCENNAPLVNANGLISERIVNRCVIDSKEWREGFSVSE